jgi:malonyl-CoA decarboxylase
MASVTPSTASPTIMPEPRSWIERLWSSVADRGRSYAKVLQPEVTKVPLDRARELATALLSERGEASGAAIARELHTALRALGPTDQVSFYRFLVQNFLPAEDQLRVAAEAYLAEPTPERATQLAQAAEPTRQELLRRMNMAQGGTAALVTMRKGLLAHLRNEPGLKPLDSDLRHLLGSWFNRGFLELRRIDWQTPAAVLEKLIAYEAVHEIQGWDDLRRRLAPDRRCFGFFHPALPGEPLIFVEVALTTGLASSVQPLLAHEGDEGTEREREKAANTAIFYSISNCQDGLRGVSFGNFLIKQVVEELKAELPRVVHFSTLSPVPGFRRWLNNGLAVGDAADLLLEDELSALRLAAKETVLEMNPIALVRGLLETEHWWEDAALADALREPLTRLCASYLTTSAESRGPADPVARFHLGNGARLERVNWLGNVAPRGINESYGIMVNYLYDPEQIEANHEAFVRGTIVRSAAVDALLGTPARPAARVKSQSEKRTRRSRKR